MKHFYFLFFLLISFPMAAQYQYLGGYDWQGDPYYLEPVDDVITAESLDMIDSALPEGFPVPEFNPHYITAGYDTDVILDLDASVYVTFVKEGAGYRNVLGFYTYDLANPPLTRPQPQDITIVFPNVSADNSGGGLNMGNKVKIGDFPAGTGIGWVLLANAWDGTKVTDGLWQVFSNPDFNPEPLPELRHHMVLLKDQAQDRIYLGVEDIRRDNLSCDNDFNDAVFYVTTDPDGAIRTENLADIESATDVTSANKGGLESNGKLAHLIAERNFNRLKTNYSKHLRSEQQKFSSSSSLVKSAAGIDLVSILPDTGMFGNEQATISSPEDLMGITNANQVFSADYYQGNKRVAAALVTQTSGGIYDHSKVICDRLNSSSLEDIRSFNLKGHELLMIKMIRASGEIEYAVSFSITSEAPYQLYSLWNIGDYPAGNYMNFQVWGSNMGQVSSIAGHILEKFEAFASLTSDKIAGTYPTVFVKHGFYEDGRLHLIVKNKTMASEIAVSGNLRTTEMDTEQHFQQKLGLTEAYEQELEVSTGKLFDVGLQLKADTSPKADVLYLADGPWGIDYVDTETRIADFLVEAHAGAENGDYRLERNVSISGEVYGTMNLFRSILPGDQYFSIKDYEALGFQLKSSSAVEVILVTEGLENWDQRYRYQLKATEDFEESNLKLTDFTNGNQHYQGERLKSIVFSIQGNYQNFEEFSLQVQQLVFTSFREAPELESQGGGLILKDRKAYNYPNPFSGTTTLVLPYEAEKVALQVYDLSGRLLYKKQYLVDTKTGVEFPLDLSMLKPGHYKAILILDEQHRYGLSLLRKL